MVQTKLVSPWPNFDYVSVLTNTTFDNLSLLLNDIHPLFREVCQENIRRLDQPKFRLKVIFIIHSNSDANFLNLPVSTKMKEETPEEKDVGKDLDKILREMIYEKKRWNKN